LTAVICDLDGVLYRGSSPIPGSAESLQALYDHGLRVVYVTNNSTRSPRASAEKIQRLSGVEVDPSEICTSAMAAASVLRSEDDPVLVVGEEGIIEAVEGKGFDTTSDPGVASSVVVGLYRSLTYETIGNAADAVRNGARFIATNRDNTYPTANGVKPGSGAMVAAIAAVAGVEPQVCGKPHAPMRALIHDLGISDAWVIGDRVDTDIALAVDEPDWRSILVLSGVTGADDPEGGADHVVADFAAAVDVVLSRVEQR
jgi:HAD superfamily hydrolase (TIGR01450 family)